MSGLRLSTDTEFEPVTSWWTSLTTWLLIRPYLTLLEYCQRRFQRLSLTDSWQSEAREADLCVPWAFCWPALSFILVEVSFGVQFGSSHCPKDAATNVDHFVVSKMLSRACHKQYLTLICTPQEAPEPTYSLVNHRQHYSRIQLGSQAAHAKEDPGRH